MLKDGHVNVLGAYLPVEIETFLDKDDNPVEINPCPKCGCKDQEVVEDTIYEPTGYRLKCANPDCGYCVPEEVTEFAYYHEDGVAAAVKTWNFHTDLEDLIKSGDYKPLTDEENERVTEMVNKLPEKFAKLNDGTNRLVNKETGDILK